MRFFAVLTIVLAVLAGAEHLIAAALVRPPIVPGGAWSLVGVSLAITLSLAVLSSVRPAVAEEGDRRPKDGDWKRMV